MNSYGTYHSVYRLVFNIFPSYILETWCVEKKTERMDCFNIKVSVVKFVIRYCSVLVLDPRESLLIGFCCCQHDTLRIFDVEPMSLGKIISLFSLYYYCVPYYYVMLV